MMAATDLTTIGLLEKTVLKTGRVTGVRPWEPGTFVEIDLHLPGVDMTRWSEAQHIKCRVNHFTFREYTIAGWDAPTHTGTLYIDAAHDGPGSRWARSVKPGDRLYYTGVGRSPFAPAPLSRLVCLGDETGVGHFLALRQLLPRTSSLTGAILMGEAAHRACFGDFLRMPLEPLCDSLEDWVTDRKELLDEGVFYVAGQNGLVRDLKRALRVRGVEPERIKAQGFWG
ncbi:siderophore-interacting protein [Dinghuibacter silviterrae]|uniref:NADPH-dependent ferric siderophore reductase n=1 Tax=Dinghuibacter silviterrae TaxID=1539049 RepID=A0A4R8DVJ1_9BACT|nr:siderophore-interacting protein [Dinghuibacter silviterrae]TDX01211.1 NADPH-dependent ferric siderophore reductase [Dinghuibacter silviterrae]